MGNGMGRCQVSRPQDAIQALTLLLLRVRVSSFPLSPSLWPVSSCRTSATTVFFFFSNVCKPVVYSSLHLLRAQWTLLSLPDPENMHIPVHCTCISLHTTPVVHLGNSPRGYVCLSVYCMAWCGEVWQMIYTVLECFVFKYPKKNLSEQPHTLKNCIARQALAWLLLKKPANN